MPNFYKLLVFLYDIFTIIFVAIKLQIAFIF
ncbi:hypothetical protein CoNPh11_CDS0141 [Staphylococcus phage S-CoN_Ph11]|nr:hypothetical protein CoNPh8_CDS0071 [Staphylococcus phage S-CoN_Ph8]WNM53198.1 hypothetical protein CoNPh11_CDS0141 [Staphylococcus phage S-CoN_Ph11]WNM53607.1 hypothetical protein CoNPh13_CDS0137 [Staphylococcus phage S-CoN_Ph13]WNM55961.1 hypothetical protein CoNPh38_CDS0085 [Staphylococcus phage S-CoN_Ph38]